MKVIPLGSPFKAREARPGGSRPHALLYTTLSGMQFVHRIM